MTDPSHQVYELYIRTTPERLWRAITDGAETPHYFFGTELQPAPREPGEPMRYVRDGRTVLDCRVIEADPPRRLVHSFVATHQDDADPESRVTWEIVPLGEVCRLTLVHEHYAGDTETSRGTIEGWPIVLNGLKTYLETGNELVITWPEAVETA